MKLSEEIFAIKLYELEQQFGKLQSQLYICQQQDHSKIKQQLQNITDEYLENELLLKKSAAGSRSSTVTLLAEAQEEYLRKTRTILNQQLAKQKTLEEQAEIAALYAEYAIDFAIHSMKNALIAALKAIDIQMEIEESILNQQIEREELK